MDSRPGGGQGKWGGDSSMKCPDVCVEGLKTDPFEGCLYQNNLPILQ